MRNETMLLYVAKLKENEYGVRYLDQVEEKGTTPREAVEKLLTKLIMLKIIQESDASPIIIDQGDLGFHVSYRRADVPRPTIMYESNRLTYYKRKGKKKERDL